MLRFHGVFFTSCRRAVTINPTKDAEVVVSIDDDSTDSGLFPFALSCTTYYSSHMP